MSLVDVLEALVVEHDQIGSPLREHLIAGPARAEVIEAVRGVGLEPPDELVDFFAWHDVRDSPDGPPRVDWFWPVGAWRLASRLTRPRGRCASRL